MLSWIGELSLTTPGVPSLSPRLCLFPTPVCGIVVLSFYRFVVRVPINPRGSSSDRGRGHSSLDSSGRLFGFGSHPASPNSSGVSAVNGVRIRVFPIRLVALSPSVVCRSLFITGQGKKRLSPFLLPATFPAVPPTLAASSCHLNPPNENGRHYAHRSTSCNLPPVGV